MNRTMHSTRIMLFLAVISLSFVHGFIPLVPSWKKPIPFATTTTTATSTTTALGSRLDRLSLRRFGRHGRGNGAGSVSPLFYQNNETAAAGGVPIPASLGITNKKKSSSTIERQQQQQQQQHRFERTAEQKAAVDEPCILEIHGVRYNLTAWAKSHPGGAKILQKFHDKNATAAFQKAQHSAMAYAMLADFAIPSSSSSSSSTTTSAHRNDTTATAAVVPLPVVPATMTSSSRLSRWRAKLFTKEDPIGIHKYLGIFCLLHFIFRFGQMYLGDVSAGLGTRRGAGTHWGPLLCLVPHAILSVSSLIFHTVPRDRVVGKPMIWQEFRVHNILFGLRSVICAAACSLAIHYGNTITARRIAVAVSSAAVLLAQIGADWATERLRPDELSGTTATMPYWEGCSVETQKRFKRFYAYAQFLATLACLAVMNPAWPLAVLLAIQLASLLMTLVRKGLLSARGYHYAYTASLIAPFFVGFRALSYSKSPEFLGMLVLGYGLYQARRRGVNKYVLWLPLIAARITVGDRFLNWSVW